MKKRALNRHKAHKSPQWPVSAPSPCAVVPQREFRPGLAAGGACRESGASGKRRSRCHALRAPGESLNRSLRRYVRTSSLRVWLRRQWAQADCAAVPASLYSLSASSADGPGQPERFVDRHPASGAAVCRGAGIAHRGYRNHRNGQMEHLTQVSAILQRGVLCSAVITPRERVAARDLVLTTLSNITYIQSNIFRFVMT